jgi:hypothetical protein
MNIPPHRLQAKFKHAHHFGVSGPYSPATAHAFDAALRAHVAAPGTRRIAGTFRGTMPVVFHVDPASGLMVMTDATGTFVSGWKLNAQQLHHVLTAGTL